jgi:hypothetical protein
MHFREQEARMMNNIEATEAKKIRHSTRQVNEHAMIQERFDRHTLAKMEIALERACEVISTAKEKHRSRRFVAKRIVECASSGNRELDSLTTVGVDAARELNASREKGAPDSSRHQISAAPVSRHTSRVAIRSFGIRSVDGSIRT